MMTEQEYLEYWKSMSADELIVRCSLYIKRIAELEHINDEQSACIRLSTESMTSALARITELEAIRDEAAKMLALSKLQTKRIAELEAQLQAAQQWQPIAADQEHEQDGKIVLIENQGQWVGIRRKEDTSSHAWLGVWLSELGCVVMRKVQPEIICCICGEPITGIDIDHRFWLHRIGCTGGECDCNLECHEECYDGHEHEYAPFADSDLPS